MAVVYQITSPSGKAYIGVAKRSASERFKKHCENSKAGHTTALANAIRKYGAQAMTVKTLIKSTPEYCFDLEIKAIKAWGTMYPKGYNLTGGGEGVIKMASVSKKKHALAMRSLEVRAAISAASKIYNSSEEAKKIKSEAMKKRWGKASWRKHMQKLSEIRRLANQEERY